jgi:hypothetical protein
MTRDDRKPRKASLTEEDARRIEHEIRGQRGADLADRLLGRDGGAHLRGASPTPALERARLEVQQWLERNLRDSDGALATVLERRLMLSTELVERNLGRPQDTLAEWLDRLLDRPNAIADLVREADREWGHRYQERPLFERPGEPPDPDDPYTIAGVTTELRRLRDVATRG